MKIPKDAPPNVRKDMLNSLNSHANVVDTKKQLKPAIQRRLETFEYLAGHLSQWKPKFLWKPTKMVSGETRWLRWAERRYVGIEIPPEDQVRTGQLPSGQWWFLTDTAPLSCYEIEYRLG